MVKRSYHLVKIVGDIARVGDVRKRPDNPIELQESALEPNRVTLPPGKDTTFQSTHWAVIVYHPYEGAFVSETTYKTVDEPWTGRMSTDNVLGVLFEHIIRAHVALLGDSEKDADPDTKALASLIGGEDDKPGSAPRGAD